MRIFKIRRMLYVYVITRFTNDKDGLTDKSLNHLHGLDQVELAPRRLCGTSGGPQPEPSRLEKDHRDG